MSERCRALAVIKSIIAPDLDVIARQASPRRRMCDLADLLDTAANARTTPLIRTEEQLRTHLGMGPTAWARVKAEPEVFRLAHASVGATLDQGRIPSAIEAWVRTQLTSERAPNAGRDARGRWLRGAVHLGMVYYTPEGARGLQYIRGGSVPRDALFDPIALGEYLVGKVIDWYDALMAESVLSEPAPNLSLARLPVVLSTVRAARFDGPTRQEALYGTRQAIVANERAIGLAGERLDIPWLVEEPVDVPSALNRETVELGEGTVALPSMNSDVQEVIYSPGQIGGRVHVLDKRGLTRTFLTNIAPDEIGGQRIGDAVFSHSSNEADAIDVLAGLRADHARRFERFQIRTATPATTAVMEAVVSACVAATDSGGKPRM